MKTLKMLPIMALIFFTSCGKDGPGGTPQTSVSGYVYEKDTQKPLEGIPVKLVDMGGGALGLAGGGGANSSQALFITGSDGYYHFELEGDGSYGIFTDGRWPDYYPLPGYRSVYKGEHNEISFTLQPKAWLSISVENVNSNNHLDRIIIKLPEGKGREFYGPTVKTSFIESFGGNTNFKVYWSIHRENTPLEIRDSSVYISGFDTTEFSIHY